jgi:Virulence-associated protein E
MTDTSKIMNYLAGLTWDGVPRIDTWTQRYLGGDETPAGRELLLDAVRRAREPGIKIAPMPVLVGPEGNGKSLAILILGGPENCSDQWPAPMAGCDLGSGPGLSLFPARGSPRLPTLTTPMAEGGHSALPPLSVAPTTPAGRARASWSAPQAMNVACSTTSWSASSSCRSAHPRSTPMRCAAIAMRFGAKWRNAPLDPAPGRSRNLAEPADDTTRQNRHMPTKAQ